MPVVPKKPRAPQSPFQAAPGGRKTVQHGTYFFTYDLRCGLSVVEMSVVFGGLQYFNGFFEICKSSIFHVALHSLSK